MSDAAQGRDKPVPGSQEWIDKHMDVARELAIKSANSVLPAARVRLPTPKQLVDAAEIVIRWAESRNDPTAQEVSMARYTADNMRLTALAEDRRRDR